MMAATRFSVGLGRSMRLWKLELCRRFLYSRFRKLMWLHRSSNSRLGLSTTLFDNWLESSSIEIGTGADKHSVTIVLRLAKVSTFSRSSVLLDVDLQPTL